MSRKAGSPEIESKHYFVDGAGDPTLCDSRPGRGESRCRLFGAHKKSRWGQRPWGAEGYRSR